MKEADIQKIALDEYPMDKFWIGSGKTARLYDQNLPARNHFIKGLRLAKKLLEADLVISKQKNH